MRQWNWAKLRSEVLVKQMSGAKQSEKKKKRKTRVRTLRQKHIWQVQWTGASGDNIMSIGHGVLRKGSQVSLANKLT